MSECECEELKRLCCSLSHSAEETPPAPPAEQVR